MARFYHWQDAGGPGRALSGNYFERFKQTLIACLVTGYAGKVAAGWAVYHDVPNGFSLVNANGRIVNFVNAWGGDYYSGARIYLVEGPISSDAALLTADLVRSGSGSPSANPQSINLKLAFEDYYSALSWTVVADDRTFTLFASSVFSNENLPWTLLHVGEDSAGNFLSIGGLNTSAMTNVQGCFSGSGFTYIRHPLTGLIISSPEPNLIIAGLVEGGTRVAYTDQVGELELSQLQVRTGTTFFSKLRGLTNDFAKQDWANESLLGLLGLPGGMSYRGQPVSIGGVEAACVSSSYSKGPMLFMCSDPSYW